jgi:para-nitrobenzyl esterase
LRLAAKDGTNTRMKRILLACLILAVADGCSKRAPESVPEVGATSRRDPPAGPVVGFEGRYGSHAWLGLPYAKAPVGELRWRAPQAPERWQEVRAAVELGAACPQFTSRLAGVEGEKGAVVGDEDCLFLNVYAPRFPPDQVPKERARLPVMVWLHGGGNVVGHGGFYEGGNLAATEKVVVVTVNYRLGPLGWMRHAALRGPGTRPEDQSGNYGTLDAIQALRWVHDNIAAFGGDPDNVTIFGESAGGRDVFALVQAPLARGLFHRAIVQSGGVRRTQVELAENLADATVPGDPNSSAEILLRLLVRDGRAKDREDAKSKAAAMSPAEVASYLREKSPGELLALYDAGVEGLIDVPQMFPDGAVLPTEDSLDSFARPGGHAGVPVMVGTNRDEDKLFLFADPENVGRILWLVPRLRDPDRYDALAEHMATVWKAAGADEPAAALQRGGAPGVYVYRFDWDEAPSVLGADLSRMIGAAHVVEIPFVFGHFDLGKEANAMFTEENEPARRELSAQMMSYWAEFARTGNPGRGGRGDLPEWKPGPSYLLLDTAAGGGLRMSDETLTEETAFARIAADPRLRNDEERCRVARAALGHAHRLGEGDLPPACGAGTEQ